MRIWVDADACPVVIKEILFRAAERTQIVTTLIANKPLRIPPSPYVKAQQVSSGFDVADNKIMLALQAGDLVITSDIPLAAQVIAAGGHALNPRGELYTTNNIKERLSMRNFMEELRNSGVDIGGASSFSQADRKAFASRLDWLLAHYFRSPSP